MAPCRVQIVLALELEAPWRPTNCTTGDTQAYPRDEHCQSAVGSAADPRRASQARHRYRADERVIRGLGGIEMQPFAQVHPILSPATNSFVRDRQTPRHLLWHRALHARDEWLNPRQASVCRRGLS